MPNFEFKKIVCLDMLQILHWAALVIVIIVDDRTQGFRPMVSSALWGKVPAARKIQKSKCSPLETLYVYDNDHGKVWARTSEES